MSEKAIAGMTPGTAGAAVSKKPNGIGLPTHVTIEHTSSCNLHCFFCEHHRVEVPVKSGLMNGELLGKVEAELLPAASTISCTVSGEPFLDKRLDQIVDMVKGYPGKTLAVVSNGLLMDERRLKVFAGLEAPLYVSVSLDTVDPEVYAIMRRGSDYATVMENIKSFKSRAASLGIKEAHLGISSVLMTHTIAGIPDMLRFAAENGVETIGLAHVTVFEKRDLPLSLFNQKAVCNATLAEARELAKVLNIVLYAPPQFALSESEIETYYGTPRPPCPYLAGRVYINSNGEVEICCRKGRPKTGNMFTQTFESIWRGEVYAQYRDRYAEGNPMPICTSCYVIETYKPLLHESDPFVLL
jgi:MoaA/NifB/PqqE/SkfB family radical SAM enzyme